MKRVRSKFPYLAKLVASLFFVTGKHLDRLVKSEIMKLFAPASGGRVMTFYRRTRELLGVATAIVAVLCSLGMLGMMVSRYGARVPWVKSVRINEIVRLQVHIDRDIMSVSRTNQFGFPASELETARQVAAAQAVTRGVGGSALVATWRLASESRFMQFVTVRHVDAVSPSSAAVVARSVDFRMPSVVVLLISLLGAVVAVWVCGRHISSRVRNRAGFDIIIAESGHMKRGRNT